ncbi:hypothetical protein HK098_004215 [Nowakowskiella sp. JEL0407]|nr:hypothetical protein HK098_004215 [Nowakowskiella sp. JEL0407]
MAQVQQQMHQQQQVATRRRITEQELMAHDIKENEHDIYYSQRYYDDNYEYRHVSLPKLIARWIPQNTLLSEHEWRSYGIKQSQGWVHYMLHRPEPHILIFRREKNYQEKYAAQIQQQQQLQQQVQQEGKVKLGGLAG